MKRWCKTDRLLRGGGAERKTNYKEKKKRQRGNLRNCNRNSSPIKIPHARDTISYRRWGSGDVHGGEYRNRNEGGRDDLLVTIIKSWYKSNAPATAKPRLLRDGRRRVSHPWLLRSRAPDEWHPSVLRRAFARVVSPAEGWDCLLVRDAHPDRVATRLPAIVSRRGVGAGRAGLEGPCARGDKLPWTGM